MIARRLILAVSLLLAGLLNPLPALSQCTDCDGDGHAWPTDCNDADAGVHPGAAETCDGFDNDCDGMVDNDPPCDTTCDSPAELGDDLRLTAVAGLSAAPSLVWTGATYGIAWADRRWDIYDQIWFARLDGTGVKLESETPVTFNDAYSVQPALVWTGTEYGLVWARDGQIWFARIDSAGNKIGLDVQVTTLGNPAQLPDLVWTGSEYGVVWRDSRDGNDEIYFTRLDASGTKIGSDVRVTSDGGQSDAPRLVWAGGEFAVTWADDRDGNGEIYFARLDGTGAKLTADIRITNDAAVSGAPDLAWTGSEYGIAWRDRRDGNGEIYFALLTAAGVQSGGDIRVTSAAGNSALPTLSWTGSEYGVAWRDRRDDNTEIYFAHLDSLGLKIGSDVRVTSDAGESDEPVMIWMGAAFGIAWMDDREGDEEIYFSRVDCSCGADLDGDGFTNCDADCDTDNNQVYPGAPQICDGLNNDCDDPLWPTVPADEIDNDGDTFAQCEDDCNDSNGDIYPDAPQLCGDGLNNDCHHLHWPSQAGTNEGDDDGDGYTECAGDCDDASDCTYPGAAPLDSASACMRDCDGDDFGDDAPPVPVSPGADCDDGGSTTYSGAPQLCDEVNNDCDHPSWPTVPADEIDDDGDLFAECADDCDDTHPDIYPGALQLCDGLNNNCIHPSWPDLTGTDEMEDWDGDGFTGCEGDCDVLDPASHPGADEICDGRDNECDGQIDELPGCALACESPDRVLPQSRVAQAAVGAREPSLIAVGSGFAMAWNACSIYFARLDLAGVRVGPEVHVSAAPAGCAGMPSLAWTGSEFGIAWQDSRDTGSSESEEIYFARLDPAGNKISRDIRVTSDPHDSDSPSLVWTGSEFGISWEDRRTGLSGTDEIYFARLDATGSKLGPDIRVTTDPHDSDTPSLVWTGSEYGVIWHDDRDGDNEIYFARLDATGTRLGPEIRVTNHADTSWRPAITWTGSEFGIAWQDERDGNSEIYFTRLDATGNKIGPDIRVTADPRDSDAPSLVWTGSEYGLVWGDSGDGYSQVYFTRLDATGLRLSSDIRVSDITGMTFRPELVWTGSRYGTVWTARSYPHTDDEVDFTQVRCDCVDGDDDGWTSCNDCDDGDSEIFPDADQLCDGKNNDCLHSSYPDLAGTNEADDDGDGFSECENDCADGVSSVYPGAPQICDGLNNDCSDPAWPALDGTNEAAGCLIDVTVGEDGGLRWASGNSYSPWNVYRGDLSVLEALVGWTQEPGSNPLAAQWCALSGTEYTDAPTLSPGTVAFYLVTGLTGDVESSLGRWRWHWGEWTGTRENDHPCP